jgi:hypothetical protein
MFTPESRLRLREELLDAARADPRIQGAAITGSGALAEEDRWSDIDLALSFTDQTVIDTWTDDMYRDHGAVHHLDVYRGTTLFRVFLLASTLQVDVAFWPPDEFGAIAPTFKLIFGTANDKPHAQQPTKDELIGTAWLYALHARSSIERGTVWQAEYMIHHMRDAVMALACLRHGVNAVQGRGLHELPAEAFAPTLVRSLDLGELRRAFSATTDLLTAEIDDPRLIATVDQVRQLSRCSPPPAGRADVP